MQLKLSFSWCCVVVLSATTLFRETIAIVNVNVNFALQTIRLVDAERYRNVSSTEHYSLVSQVEQALTRAFPASIAAQVVDIQPCETIASCDARLTIGNFIVTVPGVVVELEVDFPSLDHLVESDIQHFIGSNSSILYEQLGHSSFTGLTSTIHVTSQTGMRNENPVILSLCSGSGCTEGSICESNEQCASGICNRVCQVLNCADGVQNSNETGVDCGGGCNLSCRTAFEDILNDIRNRSTWEQNLLIVSVTLFCLIGLLRLSMALSQYRERYSDPVHRNHILNHARNLNKGIAVQKVQPNNIMLSTNHGNQNETQSSGHIRQIETCHLLADTRILEGWLDFRMRGTRVWKRQYCVLFGGEQKVFSCFDDVIPGDQNNIYLGERVRLPISSVRNVASPETSTPTKSDSKFVTALKSLVGFRYPFSVLYRPQEEHTSSFVANTKTMEALQLRATSLHDREQWVGVMRRALFDHAARKRRQIQIDLTDM